MDITFRKATLDDVESIIALCNERFNENTPIEYALDSFKKTQNDPNQIYIVGIAENKVVAHTKITIIPTMYEDMNTYAVLNHVCVKPELRREHIGTKMLDECFKIAKSDKELAEFLAISGYRYETLRDTLDYIKYLWSMTKNYVTSAQKLFDGLKSDVTIKSVESLTIVSSMSASAALLELFTESAPTFTAFGFIYFFILALIGWGSTKILNTIASKRKYEVSDIEYEKNIK